MLHSKVAAATLDEKPNSTSPGATVEPSAGPESIVVSGRTLIVTVAVAAELLKPSLTRNVKLSVPAKPAFGV